MTSELRLSPTERLVLEQITARRPLLSAKRAWGKHPDVALDDGMWFD